MNVIFLHAYRHGGGGGGGGEGGGGLCLQSHPKDFCEVCTEFDCGEISGRAQKLARNGHPSIW